MRINAAANEVVLKIVYYGPGMAGKTTNLTVIHDRVPSHAAGDLVMVDTHSERTLRFDLLAMDAGDINGHRVHFEFYTVPGQSYYAATRRAVLTGADAVVFVADSRREALDENIEAMNEMLGNLRHHGLGDDLPVLVQYNKQDLPTALKREQLEPLMNVRSWPSMSAVAVDGNGVMETMQQITAMALERVRSSGAVPTSAASLPPAAGTWLISCYRCQAMLEVPDAKVGAVYACGICGSALEVVDADRGLTRAPAPSALGAVSRQGRSPAEDSVYGMQAIPERSPTHGAGALGSTATPRPGSGSAPVLSQPYAVPGYDLMAQLDESVQGVRTRVRERSSGRTLRALALNPALMRQPSYSDNFQAHVRLASQVKHPYILPLVAMTPSPDSMVLFNADPPDYEPLGHVLARRRALAPPHAMGIVRQVALALEEAARHGVVHGWLRPEVILVSPDGNVLVDEFAVQKNHRFLVRELSGASAATEYYLAPEHLSEDIRSDVRSDIFMLGALMFRMMTGEGLVTGYNAHEALHKVVANGARTLRSIQPGVSRDLDLFCQRLVSAERKDRFQSYREVIDTLDKFGGGAKRQTLRLTQSVAATPGTPGTGQLRRTGTGQLRRTGTGQLRRTGTGQIPRGLGGDTGQLRRSTPGSGERPGAGLRPRPAGGSGAGVAIVVVIAVVVVGAVAFMLFNNPAKPKPVTPTTVAPVERPTAPPPQSLPTPPLAPKPTTTPPIATVKDPATGTSPAGAGGPNVRTPTWMAANQKPGTPTAQVPATDPVAPPVPETLNPVSEEDRVNLMSEIADLERRGLFKQALAKCERLPTVAERQSRLLQVARIHQTRKDEIEAQVATVKDWAQIDLLLQPARELWGMPEDETWVKAQLAAAEKRLGKPGTKPVAKPDLPGAIEQTQIDPAALVDGQINKSLASGQFNLAQQALSTLPVGAPSTGAIKRKVTMFDQRSALLAKVLAERSPKLRVPHPTTNEMWDIVALTPETVTVSSAGGSKTDLTWSQVSIKDLARICGEIASLANAKPEDFALATVMHLVAENTALAGVALKRGKGQLDPALGSDLDTLVIFARQRDALDLVAKAKEAAANGNSKVFHDAIEALKRSDDKVMPLVAADIAALEKQRLQAPTVTPGNTTTGAASASRDKLVFDAPEDLKAFHDRSGTWQVTAGMAQNSSDSARLGRKDMTDARAAQLIFMPIGNRGQMTVDFRGVRFEVDFASSTYRAFSEEETLKARPFTFLPKTACSMYFELRQPGNLISITVNNGADAMAIKGGTTLTDNFIITCTSANVAIDDLQIMRGKPATNKEAQGELRKLGLEPLGDATLEAPTIVLPTAQGTTSGVALPLRDNIIGASFDAKGIGMLRVQLGSPTDRSGQWIDVPLGAVPVPFKVSWVKNMLLVTDGAGNELGSVALTGKHTHLMIIALKEATLLSTPRLTYQ
jgi:mutual gliding-motility protein MglA